VLRVVGRNSMQKNYQKFSQKIMPINVDSINPKKIWHYDGRKMDFPEITNILNIAKQSKNMI
jgi:hypothetical protein